MDGHRHRRYSVGRIHRRLGGWRDSRHPAGERWADFPLMAAMAARRYCLRPDGYCLHPDDWGPLRRRPEMAARRGWACLDERSWDEKRWGERDLDVRRRRWRRKDD